MSDPFTPPEFKRPPGACVTFDEKKEEFPQVTGDRELVERVWKDIDGLGYTYIWQVLLSF